MAEIAAKRERVPPAGNSLFAVSRRLTSMIDEASITRERPCIKIFSSQSMVALLRSAGSRKGFAWRKRREAE